MPAAARNTGKQNNAGKEGEENLSFFAYFWLFYIDMNIFY